MSSLLCETSSLHIIEALFLITVIHTAKCYPDSSIIDKLCSRHQQLTLLREHFMTIMLPSSPTLTATEAKCGIYVLVNEQLLITCRENYYRNTILVFYYTHRSSSAPREHFDHKIATVKQSVWKMPSAFLKIDIGHQVFPL